MPAITPPPADHSRDLRELAEMFDRLVAGYFWAVDHEEWTAAWEYLDLIERVHDLEEGLAA